LAQISAGKPNLTTRGPISPVNRNNNLQVKPADDQTSPQMGFRLPLVIPDRSTLRHVDVSHKVKTEEKSPPWVRDNITAERKPNLRPRASSSENLRVPTVSTIQNLPKTPPPSPVSQQVSPHPPPIPARARQGSDIKLAVPQNPNVMLGMPTSPPVMQSPPSEYFHPQLSPPPVPRRVLLPKTSPVHVIEAQAPSSPEVSRAASFANAPVEHSAAATPIPVPPPRPVVVQHVTVHSPPFSHDPLMRHLGYGQDKSSDEYSNPKGTVVVPGPATTELPPNNSRVYKVDWKIQPNYSASGSGQQKRPGPHRKLSLEDINVNTASPSQSAGVRDRSATLPRVRTPLNYSQTIR